MSDDVEKLSIGPRARAVAKQRWRGLAHVTADDRMAGCIRAVTRRTVDLKVMLADCNVCRCHRNRITRDESSSRPSCSSRFTERKLLARDCTTGRNAHRHTVGEKSARGVRVVTLLAAHPLEIAR